MMLKQHQTVKPVTIIEFCLAKGTIQASNQNSVLETYWKSLGVFLDLSMSHQAVIKEKWLVFWMNFLGRKAQTLLYVNYLTKLFI